MRHNIKLRLFIAISIFLCVNNTSAWWGGSKDGNTDNKNTKIVYLSPGDYLDRHFALLDRYWNDVFDDRLPFHGASSIKSKIITEDAQYTIIMEVPGYDKNDIKIKVQGRRLVIHGVRRDTDTNKNTKDYPNQQNQFDYTISLSDDVDQKAISSSLKNGILAIILPRIKMKEENSREVVIQ